MTNPELTIDRIFVTTAAWSGEPRHYAWIDGLRPLRLWCLLPRAEALTETKRHVVERYVHGFLSGSNLSNRLVLKLAKRWKLVDTTTEPRSPFDKPTEVR